LGENPFFTLPRNLVVLFKELEQKLNRLEINFYKNVSYHRHFAKVIEKKELFLVETSLDD